MVPDREDLLQETYKIARDNNRMLHAMRRNAFVGGLIKFVIYAVLIIAPLWFFAKYVSPILNSAVSTLNQVQGGIDRTTDAGAQVGAQFSGVIDQLKKIPGFGNLGQ